MKILFLAPQPFFQERGTPIAVRLALQVLSQRRGVEVDLVTYPEGEEVSIPNVQIIRSYSPKFLYGVRPGLSMKKLLCDLFFTWTVFAYLLRQGPRSFQLVHAVEESVFLALVIRYLFGIPYIYDMDSSLSLQVTESWRALRIFRPILSWLERQAIRSSLSVAPVCDALAVVADSCGARSTVIIRDTPLFQDEEDEAQSDTPSLRDELGLSAESFVFMYVGNLERYQGIDLLVQSFEQIAPRYRHAQLVVIGGKAEDVDRYREHIRLLGLHTQVHFAGPRPIAQLRHYISAADVLVSPRTLGNNTPMKVYSYLHSGKPLVATRIASHTQVLDDSIAILADATPESFAAALQSTLDAREQSIAVAHQALERARRLYTFEVFSSQLNHLYDIACREISGETPLDSVGEIQRLG